MICRKLTAFGIPPIIALSIGSIAFYLLSNLLFETRKHAIYIYLALAISLLLKANNYKKHNFLKTHFSKLNVFKIQFLEKFILMMPFVLYSVFRMEFIIGIVMLGATVFTGFFSFRNNHTIYLPTPFSKKPFEFCVGFRKTFYLFPLCYALAVISAYVGNFNLGIFALIPILLMATNFYTKIEPNFYIWNHNLSPKEFLNQKIKLGVLQLLLLQLPIILILIISFPKNIDILLISLLVSSLAISTRISVKYAIKNPSKVNLEEIIYYLSLAFLFPTLLILLPYYYKQAIQKLSTILND